MIIKGKERGSAAQLGAYLLRVADNDRVEVHEVSGFMAGDVFGAMREADAIAKGTRCRNHLFSISLNPPQTEMVRIEVFEGAIAKIEERVGLQGQPRIVVFHEKDGRRHAHVAWSRIQAEEMKAIQLSFYKQRLREVSKEQFLENGWTMPRGLMDSKARDPRNIDFAEWQQCKRIGRNAKDLKSIVQECWAVSDDAKTFARALEERGLYLARGRRGHVTLSYEGEPLSIARYVGKKAKEITAKLGEPDSLPSVEETRAHIAQVIAPKLQGLLEKAQHERSEHAARLDERRASMRLLHNTERAKLDEGQRLRLEAETRERALRIRTGVRGLWDKLRGEYAKTMKQNQLEAMMSLQRDREQRARLVSAQVTERWALQQEIQRARHVHTARVTGLHRDLARQTHDLPRQAAAEAVQLTRLKQQATPQERLHELSGTDHQRSTDDLARALREQPSLKEQFARLTAQETPQQAPERGPELER